MEERYAVANGVRLHYLEWGQPGDPAVVLLHGASGFCHDWDLVGEELQDRFRCLAPDLPGFGDSDWPGVADTDKEAEDVAAGLATLDVARAFVVGHSRSGRIALGLAARHPDLALSLTLVDASPGPPTSNPPRPNGPFATVEEAMAAFRPFYPLYEESRLRGRLALYLKDDARGRLVVKRDLAAREGPRSDGWAALAQVRCPVLLVLATDSHVAPESLERMRGILPGLEVVDLECTHNVPAERPRELAAAIAAFAGRTMALA